MPPNDPKGGEDPTVTPPVTVEASAPDVVPPVPKDDSRKLAVMSFSSGDSFTYTAPDGSTYVIGTQPTPVPKAVAAAILSTARSVGVQVSDVTPKQEG